MERQRERSELEADELFQHSKEKGEGMGRKGEKTILSEKKQKKKKGREAESEGYVESLRE